MASGKEMSTTIKLGGKIDASLGKALEAMKSKAASAAEKMGAKMKHSTKSATRSMKSDTNVAAKAMTSALKGFAKTAGSIFAAIKAAGKMKDFALECVNAAKQQIEVETKLETILSNVEAISIRGPNAVQEAADKLKNVASGLQEIGVIGDEVTLAGMQQLATFQLTDDQIAQLSTGMTDLLAQQKGLNASQGDAVTIANMIGKAMSGNVGALSKVGISFTEAQEKAIKLGDANKRAATIAEVLQKNVGGVNEAMAQTDQGKLQQSSNILGDMKETIGMHILPILAQIASNVMPYVTKGFDKLTEIMDKAGPIISDMIKNGFDKLKLVIPFIQEMIQKALPVITKYFDKTKEIGKKIIPILNGGVKKLWPIIERLVETCLPFADELSDVIIPLIEEVMQAIVPIASEVLTTIQVILASIIPIISEIASVILPVIIDLISRLAPVICDVLNNLTPLIAQIIENLLPVIESLLPPIVNLVEFLLPPVINLVNSILPLIESMIPLITWLASVIGEFLVKAIEFLTPILTDVINTITSIIDALTEVINYIVGFFAGGWKDAWQGIKDTFSRIFSGFIDIAKAPINAVIGLVNKAIDGVNGLTGVINKIPGVKIPDIQHIPMLAKGATLTKPTIAMVAEAGVAETVIPHTNTARSRMLLAQAAQGVGVNLQPQISKSERYISEKTLIERPNNHQNKMSDEEGGNQSSRQVINQYYFNPTVSAQDATGVEAVLEDQYERFKQWQEQFSNEKEREDF